MWTYLYREITRNAGLYHNYEKCSFANVLLLQLTIQLNVFNVGSIVQKRFRILKRRNSYSLGRAVIFFAVKVRLSRTETLGLVIK